jgi:hypothetical protein
MRTIPTFLAAAAIAAFAPTPLAQAAPCGSGAVGDNSFGTQACADCLHSQFVPVYHACTDPNEKPPPQPVYVPPANIPPDCQKYVGPDAQGNDQNGSLRLCITAHQATG